MNAHILTTFLVTLLVFISHTTLNTTASTTTTPKAYKKFILTSCNSTTYPTLCIKTLSPYASSVQTSPYKLCNAALAVTLQAARNASSLVSKMARQKGITPSEGATIKDCIDNIKDSIDELKQSIKAMGSLGNSTDKEFQMSNMKTWMSAALTDEDTCTDGFAERKGSLALKNMIKTSILGVAKLTSNALALINHLT